MGKKVKFIGVAKEEEGHKRITKTKHGDIIGGDAEQHSEMRSTSVKINKSFDRIIDKHGEDADPRFFEDAIKEALE